MSIACSGYGQTANGQPAFEVASIRPVPPPEPGKPIAFGSPPGSNDAGRYTCNFCNLSMLITQAYGIQGYQLSAPVSMDDQRFDITAKIPEGSPREQVMPMLQNLLAERFQLAIHRETKEAQVYELMVAKGGPKFPERAEESRGAARDTPPPVPGTPGRQTMRDKDGFPILPPGSGTRMFTLVGRARLQAENESMEYLAKVLSNQVGKPVTDATGLKAKYDFTLTWDGNRGIAASASDADSMPTIFTALQSQLGLKLEQKKGQVETIVVDHGESPHGELRRPVE